MGKDTEYKISTSEKEGILEIVIKGEITKDSIGKLQSEVIEIIKSKNLQNVLADVRKLKGRFGYTEAYFRVRNYPSDIPRVNTACVDLVKHADYQNFHENTTVNAGYSFKWFTNVDDARAWLKKISEKQDSISMNE
ncbi:MAG: hypothetical protein LLG40_10935 [Deltaproteobacteria bacterium]|nr:hypothetical protein [Deltaproteobacteria bacterium]